MSTAVVSLIATAIGVVVMVHLLMIAVSMPHRLPDQHAAHEAGRRATRNRAAAVAIVLAMVAVVATRRAAVRGHAAAPTVSDGLAKCDRLALSTAMIHILIGIAEPRM